MVVTLIGMVGIRQLYLYLVMRPGADIRLLFYGYPLGWLSATILLLIYALIIRSYPTALMNFFLVGINIYQMIRLTNKKNNYSLAEASAKPGYVRPVFNHDRNLRIESGRHPILESVHSDTPYIANSVVMDPETNVLIITGPNMGGKSTLTERL